MLIFSDTKLSSLQNIIYALFHVFGKTGVSNEDWNAKLQVNIVSEIVSFFDGIFRTGNQEIPRQKLVNIVVQTIVLGHYRNF